jgi:membrane protein YdbS with pleckstrin-like domain
MYKLDRFLNANEKVWSGKPQKKALRPVLLGALPIDLAFLAFYFFFFWTPFPIETPYFTIFGLPFLLIGIAAAIGPLLWQLLRFRNTEYMIIDKRLITQSGAIGLDTRFVEFVKIQEVYGKFGIVDRLCGTGSLYAMTAGTYGFSPTMGSYGYGFWGMQGSRPSRAALEKPYEVQKLLQEAVEILRATTKSEEV